VSKTFKNHGLLGAFKGMENVWPGEEEKDK